MLHLPEVFYQSPSPHGRPLLTNLSTEDSQTLTGRFGSGSWVGGGRESLLLSLGPSAHKKRQGKTMGKKRIATKQNSCLRRPYK